MKILVLNRGSSSIKCSLYEFSSFPREFVQPLWEENIDSLNLQKIRCLSKEKIDCIGHRIVHGGRKFQTSVRITSRVKNEIRKLADLAPLHNLADLEGIAFMEHLFPNVPQIAVFDTAFHHTLPLKTALYPGPYRWYEEGIQRYGFHGMSFQYCSKKASEIIGKKIGKIVICHLGSGASLCAVRNGKSVDTTMGFTPLEGLMMDTRSGTVDPGILLYLLKHKQKTVDTLSRELYEKSGLLGLSGFSSDMREVLANATKGRAKLAVDVYVHRLTSLIGSMVASLSGIDALVFTAGIGENAPLIRKRVCKNLSFLGIELSDQKNQRGGKDAVLSGKRSKVDVLLIHTQEAFEIARECWRSLGRVRNKF